MGIDAFMDTHLVLPVRELSREEQAALREVFTHNNPLWSHLNRMGMWTGPTKKNPQGVPNKIISYREDGPFLLLPRGSRGKVEEVLGRALEVEDRTLRLEPVRYSLKGKLRPYQADAVEVLAEAAHPGCALKGPPGSGKTVTMLAAVARIGQPALVVVHTKPLMAQWLTAAEQWLGVTPGTVGGGRQTALRSVTVGMQQTLWRLVKAGGSEARDLARSFGCLVIDEAHHAPAASFLLVSEHFSAAYRLGCSATIKRKDGKEFLLYETFGKVAHEITKDDLKRAGKLLPMRMEVVPTAFTDDDYLDALAAGDPTSWQPMITRMIADDDRNALVWEHLQRVLVKKGSRVLLLNDRVRACKDWAEFLRGQGVSVGLLIGGDKIVQAETIKGLRVGNLRVGVGTKIADEGLDLPELTHVFVTCPVHGNPMRLTQMVGRAARPVGKKKEGVAVYFWDELVWPKALARLKGACDQLEVLR